MRAGQVTSPRYIEVVDIPEPGLPPEGACLVRMTHIGMCGSDVRRGFRAQPGAQYPLAPGFPGHECMGTVVTSNAAGYTEGDRVLLHPPGLLGLQEYVVVDSGRLALVPEPETEPHKWLMCEPAATVLHALHRSPRVMGKRVAVIGQGTMGLIWTALLRRLGAVEIHTVDLEASRLEMSERFGADTTVCLPADKQGEFAQYGELASFDMVIEAAGEVASIAASLHLARREGFVALFGTPADERVELDYRRLRDHELSTMCSAPGQGERVGEIMQEMVDVVAAGWIDLSPLVTHELSFEDVNQAFVMADERQEGCVRVVVRL